LVLSVITQKKKLKKKDIPEGVGPINTSNLFVQNNTSFILRRKDIILGSDFVLVTASNWIELVGRYGGGPPLRWKVINDQG
jgi:hypothetical protein